MSIGSVFICVQHKTLLIATSIIYNATLVHNGKSTSGSTGEGAKLANSFCSRPVGSEGQSGGMDWLINYGTEGIKELIPH